MPLAQTLMGSGVNPQASRHIVGDVDTGEAAAGSSSQANATVLSMRAYHWIKTGAGNSGVCLPPGLSTTGSTLGPGDTMVVYNNTGNTILVYPPGTGTINGGSASASVSLTNHQVGMFMCLDGGTNANFCSLIV